MPITPKQMDALLRSVLKEELPAAIRAELHISVRAELVHVLPTQIRRALEEEMPKHFQRVRHEIADLRTGVQGLAKQVSDFNDEMKAEHFRLGRAEKRLDAHDKALHLDARSA